jgi:hypothetical protein
MRSATASRSRVWGSAILLAGTLAACGTDGPTRDGSSADAAVDRGDATVAPEAGDARVDAPADARGDAPVDAPPDLPPVDVINLLCQGISPTFNYADPYVVANFDGLNDQTFSPYGVGEPISGGTYLSDGITPDYSGMNWNLTGNVAGAGHFGVYWTCSSSIAGSGGCTLDVSRFKGIRFKIKGDVGPDHAMTLSLGRAENDLMGANAMCGSCVVPSTSDAAVGDYCRGPRYDFAVPADGSEKVVTVLWTDFDNGSPHASIDPHQITGMLWIFHPLATPDGGVGGLTSDAGGGDAVLSIDAAADADASDGSADSDAGDARSADALPPLGYPINVTIDDIEFVPF